MSYPQIPASVYSLKTFLTYGENPENIDVEIRSELLNIIKTSVTSMAFGRAQGSGAEFLENENFSPEAEALFKAQLVTNIMAYNKTVPEQWQVAVSQDYIEIETNDQGDNVINVYYIQLKDLSTSNSSLKNIILPMVS